MSAIIVQMMSLELQHKNELTAHFKRQEKELESLWGNYEKELERLRSKLKQEANQKVNCYIEILHSNKWQTI